MKDSKLIRILKTLSGEEFRNFEIYLSSPYFNSSKIIVKYFNELKKFYPDFNDNLITSEYFYAILYKGKRFNKQVMWNLSSQLEKLAKDYLELIAFSKQSYKRKELLLTEMGKRKLMKSYLSILNDLEKNLETGGIDYDYFENKGHLEDVKQNYYHRLDQIGKMGDSKAKASEYQIMMSLRMTVGGLNDMNILMKDHGLKFDVNIPMEFAKNLNLKNIYNYACDKNYEFSFLIGIYYHALMLFLKPDDEKHIDTLRVLFGQHYNRFTLSEKRNIMHWILNYCSPRAMEGNMKYRRIMFELNKLRVKEGLVYYPEGQIPRATYLQIFYSALSVKEFKWAENFLENYTSKLQPQLQQSISAIAYANLHFMTKDFEKVLDDLKKARFVNLKDKIDSRILLSQAYYELKEVEVLLYHIDSSLHFLKRNPSFSKSVLTPTNNFFTFLKKLAMAKEKSGIPVLRNTLLKKKEIEERKWLLKKLEEMI